ncbi:hypothetical protein EON62_01680, partial [archaeon]
LQVEGANFGSVSTPVVYLGSATRSWLRCTNVTRESHFRLSCLLPEGSGSGLSLRVTVADLTGVGGNFSYLSPTISRMTLLPRANVTAAVYNSPTLTNLANGVANVSMVPAVTNAATRSGRTIAGSAHGGYVMVLDGSNLGTHDSVHNCLFVAWPQRASVTGAAALSCNTQDDYLGEGEVHENDVLFYDHERVIFVMPPGAGSREVTLRAGGQAPTSASEYINFVYNAPALSVTSPALRVQGEASTNGGTRVDLVGSSFPFPTVNNASAPVVFFPRRLGLPAERMLPTEHVRVNFGSPTSATPCIASAYGYDGLPLSGFSSCVRDGIVEQVFGVNGTSATGSQVVSGADVTDVLTFLTPPGVGVNRSVSLSLVSAGVVVAASIGTAKFSYAPPVITDVQPAPLYDDGEGGKTVSIRGRNFGRLADMQYFSDEERVVDVQLANVACENPQRIIYGGMDMIQCGLARGAPVGYSNITIRVAGQTGFVAARTFESLLVVCLPNYFGHTGETCAPCPVGAACRGFVEDMSLAANSSAVIDGTRTLMDFSNGSIFTNDIEYDMRGLNT